MPKVGALAAAKSAGIPAGGVHTAVDWLGEAGITLMGDHRAVDGVYGVYVGCAIAACWYAGGWYTLAPDTDFCNAANWF